ncbi:MAG: TM0106 family RecB-like putative nuclease [Candidatus Eisenbacteria bacterium]
MLATPTGFRFSASDLNNYAECEHLAWLEAQAARGQVRPDKADRDPMADLLAKRGRAHEQAYLAKLEESGLTVTRIAYDPKEAASAIEATREAMRRGDRAIYQAVLQDGRWFGIADFLERVETPSGLGAWSYEVADTKLARRTKPYYLLQLSLYSDLVARVQGVSPAHMHVILGDSTREPFACRDFGTYFRGLKARFERTVEVQEEPSYPLPVEHCGLCRWAASCERRREADDHLCRVANIRRLQITRLEGAGVRTMAALGALPAETRVARIPTETLERLRSQARLQVEQRADGQARYELLPLVEGKGLALLPAPSAGDVFFDMEGDPYFEGGGLEYLFGADFLGETGKPAYRAWWGHNHAEERRAFEAFIDFVVARRAHDTSMHVYHYAPYEPSALKRLAARYGTREAELDDLLRGQVLVDLFTVVRQGLRASFPSYSIKDIEHFYMGPRHASVKHAGDSIVEYELWIESHDRSKLEAIERYNEEDCISTRLLRDWLIERRAEAHSKFGQPAPPPPTAEPPAPDPERLRDEAERAELIARLTDGLGPDPATLIGAERGRWLMAQLVEYHKREERPQWWMYFARMQMTEEELLADTESVALLVPDPKRPPVAVARSKNHTFTYPTQEHKLSRGTQVIDPSTGAPAGEIADVDVRTERLVLKRGPKLADVSLPVALIPAVTYNTVAQRAAVRRVAQSIAANGIKGPGPYRALRDLLLREFPRVAGMAQGAALQGAHLDVEAAWKVVSALDESYVFVQGPPGSGKTWLGARLIVRLMREGKRVGVTALSHRAIHNLLDEVEKVAAGEGFAFRGLKKCSGDGGPEDETAFRSELPRPLIANTTENPEAMPAGCLLLAGTAWLFSREPLTGVVDYLFVDEAGQVSLADAIAVGTAATNLVLLGDPQQLPQVSQGVHPEGAGASVLEHVLGDHDTIPPERGLFLEQTWRMHPDVCRFISELAYEERLVSAPGRERQLVSAPAGLSGAGLRYLPVEHTGNSQRSPEEASVIAAAISLLLAGGTFTCADGTVRALLLTDILVVAPYNAQVQTLLATLPPGAQVGTVDKFQGREAAVVFFSMATSSGDEMPRDLEFLFSRNRLNVAISRARALAVLVASPRLLQVRCAGAGEMRMVNGVCRLVEEARGSH